MSNYKQYIIKRKRASNYEPHMLGGDAFLAHHGILGMKWGVRRYQNPDGSYTAAGRARYGIGEKEYVPGSNKNQIGIDNDIYIKSGAKAYRVSAKEKDTSKTRYITVEKDDNAFYAKNWTQLSGQGNTSYQQEYDIRKDIKAPSLKKRVEICNELYTDKNLKEIAKVTAIENYYQDISGNVQAKSLLADAGLKTLDDMRDLYDGKKKGKIELGGTTIKFSEIRESLRKNAKDGEEYFRNVSDSLERANIISGALHGSPSLMAQYGKKILERGYNATIDDHGTDASEIHRMAKLPIITFDSNNSLVQKGSKIIDRAEREAAARQSASSIRKMNSAANSAAVGSSAGLYAGYLAGLLGTVITGNGLSMLAAAGGGTLAGYKIGRKIGERGSKNLVPTISDYRYGKDMAYRKKTDAQIIAAYKREHPNTKLSKSQIIKNYFGGDQK